MTDNAERWQRILRWAESNGRPERARQARDKLRELGALDEDGTTDAPEGAQEPDRGESSTQQPLHQVAPQRASEEPDDDPYESAAFDVPLDPLRDLILFKEPRELGYEKLKLAAAVDGEPFELEEHRALVKHGTERFPQPIMVCKLQHTLEPWEWTAQIVQHYADRGQWEIFSEWHDDAAYVGRVVLGEMPTGTEYGLTFTASCDSSMAQQMRGTLYFPSPTGGVVPYSPKAMPSSYRKYTSGKVVDPDQLMEDVQAKAEDLEAMSLRLEDFQTERVEDHEDVLEALLAGKLPDNRLPEYIDKGGEGILWTQVPERLWDVFRHCAERVWAADLATEQTRHTYWDHIHRAFKPVETYLALTK